MREYLQWRSKRPHPCEENDWDARFALWLQERPEDASQTLFVWSFITIGFVVGVVCWWIGLNGGLHNYP